jgi:hypothetical protein
MTPVGPITQYQPALQNVSCSCKVCKTNTFVILLNLLFGFILIVYASTLLYCENIKQVMRYRYIYKFKCMLFYLFMQ